MGETVPGGRYIGIDGKYHDSEGRRLHAPKAAKKKRKKKAAPAAKAKPVATSEPSPAE